MKSLLEKIMKELTITAVTKSPNLLRLALEEGPVRLVWKEQKPNGKVVFSATCHPERVLFSANVKKDKDS